MEHYDDKEIVEVSGDCYVGSGWSRAKKQNAIELMVENLLHWTEPKGLTRFNMHERCPRVEQLEFRTVGTWWYAKWCVSYPPDFDTEFRAFSKSQWQYSAERFYNTTQSEPINHNMKRKLLQTVEGDFQKRLIVFEKTKALKQAASEQHSIAYADLELLATMHKAKINPDDEGVHIETLDGKTWLVSFHKHREVRFKPEFDLAKAFRRFPQAFTVKGDKGTVSLSVDTVRELQKDKIASKALEKLGMYIAETKVFYVGNQKEEAQAE